MIRTPMMLMLNTEDVINHAEIRKSVQDIAENGFDAICFEFRRSEYSEFDPIGMAAMRVAYEEAKRLGKRIHYREIAGGGKADGIPQGAD